MTAAYEDYQQLQVLKQPLAGVYLSFFLMLTLMILIGSTWMGLYLAKRITRPIQLLATAAREIGAGHLDHRVVPETQDEFGSLIEAFNSMAGELAASRRRLERSAVELERKHHDVEGRQPVRRDDSRSHRHRRRFGRCARPHPHREFRRGAPARHRRVGRRAAGGEAFGNRELQPLADVIDEALAQPRRHPPARCVADARRTRAASRRHGHAAAARRRRRPTASSSCSTT